MPNNEWNRLVGKRWRELSAKEHEPFRMQALQDKKRYEAVSIYCALFIKYLPRALFINFIYCARL